MLAADLSEPDLVALIHADPSRAYRFGPACSCYQAARWAGLAAQSGP